MSATIDHAAGPLRIEPDEIYDDGALRLLLGVSSASLSKARRTGDLRYSRRGQRTYYLGRWVREWLVPDAGNPEKLPREHDAS